MVNNNSYLHLYIIINIHEMKNKYFQFSVSLVFVPDILYPGKKVKKNLPSHGVNKIGSRILIISCTNTKDTPNNETSLT